MPQNIGRTVIKVVVWSLVIGLLLAAFDIEPKALLEGLGETAQAIFDVVAGFIEWTVPYILLGAVVVIPIWLIMAAIKIFRRKTRR
jgi:Na+/H+-dicarboxylate symporter